MPATYELRIRNRAGALTDIVTGGGMNNPTEARSGFRRLSYTKRVNQPGLCEFIVRADHPLIANLEPDSQIEVWRKDDTYGIAWYRDFGGLFVDEIIRNDDDTDQGTFIGYAVGYLDFLTREIVAYKADTSNRNAFSSTEAETIAKTLVTYNATSAGTTGDGRVRNTETWATNITVQADAASGAQLDYRCAWRNLHTALLELSDLGLGDFDLVKTGAQAWQFRWYDGQLGTDRSTDVVFSLRRGNMSNPELRRNRRTEATVAIVGGQGEESSREVVSRTGANYNSAYNARAVFVQASQFFTTDGLNAAGDARLEELRARDSLSFRAIQTPGNTYGLHYFLGDLVKARFYDFDRVQKIYQVEVIVEPSATQVERVNIVTANPPGAS